jgi:adenine phosphoribosyltransferase
MNSVDLVKRAIRDIPDFPKPGILFRDITPVLTSPQLFRLVIDWFSQEVKALNATKIVAIESRGFFLAAPVADRLELGLVLARKKGKLPFQSISSRYALEYGEAELEMHIDSLRPDERVVIIDDLIATGGTVGAAVDLCRRLKASPVAALALIDLSFLKGIEALAPLECRAMVRY